MKFQNLRMSKNNITFLKSYEIENLNLFLKNNQPRTKFDREFQQGFTTDLPTIYQ